MVKNVIVNIRFSLIKLFRGYVVAVFLWLKGKLFYLVSNVPIKFG